MANIIRDCSKPIQEFLAERAHRADQLNIQVDTLKTQTDPHPN